MTTQESNDVEPSWGGAIASTTPTPTETPTATPTATATATATATPANFSSTVLRSNDGELFPINAPGQPNFGVVARFATVVNNLRTQARDGGGGVLLLNSGDNIIPGPNFQASLVRNRAAGENYFDSIALRRIGFDALGIGNHELDLGPDVFANFVEDFNGQGRFLAANLDYSGEPRLQQFETDGVNLQFLFNIAQAGQFRFFVVIEALNDPQEGSVRF